MSDDSDPAVDQAVDCALTRTVEAQETFVREPAPEKADIVQRMNEFRDGKRPATIMHQIAKGYTPEQVDVIAAWFAAQKAR